MAAIDGRPRRAAAGGAAARRDRRPHLDRRVPRRRATRRPTTAGGRSTLVREHAERFGVRPDAVGMIGFSAGAFLAVDVALDPRAEPLAFVGADLRRRDARRAGAGRCAAAVHRRRPGRHPRARSSRASTPTGRRPTARRSCTCSPAAATASAWSGRACRRTAGPTCSSPGSTTWPARPSRQQLRSRRWPSGVRLTAVDDEEFLRWYGPWSPRDVGGVERLLDGFEAPWWVVGGYAIERFTGVARRHEDIDVAVLRSDASQLLRFLAADFHAWANSFRVAHPDARRTRRVARGRSPDLDPAQCALAVGGRLRHR